jgi:PQQ enzyme repeat
MSRLALALLAGPNAALFAQPVPRAGDWPIYGRDPGGSRYSMPAQVNVKNVATLRRAWTYHTGERGRSLETTPIVVDNVLYFSTQNQKIVALEADTGKEIWKYDPKSNTREHRGVAYWPGDSRLPPRILFGTVTPSRRRTPRVRFSEEDLRAAGPPLPEGAGKELVARMCSKCHGTAVFSRIRMTRGGWEDEVADMVEKGAAGTPDEIRRVVDYLARHYGENQSPQK